MLKTVKAPLLFVICSFFAFLSQSQTIRLPLTSQLAGEIKKLVNDYPRRFATILGDEIEKNPQSTSYNCTAKISGAEKSTITLYSSAGGSSCSWEGLMLTTENFEEAKKKYKSISNQLNNLQVNANGNSIHFKGKYDEPAEEKKFAGTVLSPDRTVDGFTKLRLEISLQYELLEWKVRILLYDKEKEDNERGKITE